MSRRTILGFKLATVSIGFLLLTIASALLLRAVISSESSIKMDRVPASVNGQPALFEHRGVLSANELGLLGSTPLVRGRKVVFHLAVLERYRNQDASKSVVFNLFPDTVLLADLQPPSIYGVNEGLVVGQIHGDPESSVRLMIQNRIVDGTIITGGREFRITDGGSGLHYVTEVLK